MSKQPTSIANWFLRAAFLLLTLSVFLSMLFPGLFPFSQEEAAAWVTSKPMNRLLFVGIQTVQVLIPPISHYFTSMLGGYIYGPFEGGTLNYVGRLIGQFIAYGLTYYAAGRFAQRESKALSRFRDLVAGHGKKPHLRALIIFTMIALPFFPDDELSYAMGFARFPFPLFALVTVFGHLLGSYALAFLGSGQEFKGPLFTALASFTVLCFIGLAWASIRYRRSKFQEVGGEDA